MATSNRFGNILTGIVVSPIPENGNGSSNNSTLLGSDAYPIEMA